MSLQTIFSRISYISANIFLNLKDKIKNFEFSYLCYDERNDLLDNAQLFIFIQGMNEDFNIVEELLDLNT